MTVGATATDARESTWLLTKVPECGLAGVGYIAVTTTTRRCPLPIGLDAVESDNGVTCQTGRAISIADDASGIAAYDRHWWHVARDDGTRGDHCAAADADPW